MRTVAVVAVAVGGLLALAGACSTDEGGGGGSGFEERSTGGVAVLRDPDGRVASVRGRFPAATSGAPRDRAEAFVDEYRDALGLPEEVGLGEATVYGSVIETVVFELTAGGHPIEGARLRVRLTPDEVFFVSVSAPHALPEVLSHEIDGTAAEAAVASIFPDGTSRGEPTLVVYAPSMWTGDGEPARLAWRVPVQAGEVPSAPVVFVDAIDGTEIGRLEQVRTALDRTIYDSHGWIGDANLRDHRELIYDESGPVAGATTWEEADLAYAFAEQGCGFLETGFGEDGACDPLVVYLNYGDPGYAAMDRGDLQFGEGALTDPTEGYRTFAHELGHALIRRRTDDFTYWGESGAVQESLADVISMLASMPDRWVVDPGHEFERNLSDPAAAGNPTTYAGRATGVADNGETHENSVILSHALWLATVEGVDVGATTVSGMDYVSMTSIVDELLSGYLGGAVSLHQAAASLVDACMVHPMFRDVFGFPAASVTFRDCGLLVNALAEVGLSAEDLDLDGWPDDADNCPLDFNPYQYDDDSDGLGNECDADAPEPDYPDYPEEPPVWPDCPAEFPTNLSDGTPVVAGPGDAPATGRHTSLYIGMEPAAYYEFWKRCHYRYDRSDGYVEHFNFTAHWTPYDPAEYGVNAHRACFGPGVFIEGERKLHSATRMASVQAGTWVSWADASLRAFLEGWLPEIEALAVPCPAE